MGGLGELADLRGSWQDRGEGVFFREELIPPCMLWQSKNVWSNDPFVKVLDSHPEVAYSKPLGGSKAT